MAGLLRSLTIRLLGLLAPFDWCGGCGDPGCEDC